MDEDGFTGWHELFENILKLYNKEKEKNRELEEIENIRRQEEENYYVEYGKHVPYIDYNL